MGFKVSRRSAGQWMTDGDPFYMDFLHEWMDNALQHKTVIRACEPYAGTLSLIRYFNNDFPEISDNIEWSAFDISPAHCNERTVDKIDIMAANTLFNIPGAPYDLIVTNPPYLARNSARRRKLDFPFNTAGVGIQKPADLYQFALDTCLNSAEVCVMLIPESFITSKYDKTRCDAIISLRGDLFNDTDCPVCLALFSNAQTATTKIIANDGSVIGNIEDIIRISDELIGNVSYDFVMNDPQGDVALFGVDNQSGATIRFAKGSEVPSVDVKNTSRALTFFSKKPPLLKWWMNCDRFLTE